MKMGSIDLIIYSREGSEQIPYCQVGRDEQMRLFECLINSEVSLNQPEEMTEKVSSKMDLDQQMQLTEEEDLRNLIMIGGIHIFLPFAQEEVENCVADAATTTEQLVETVRKEELE
jgi:hypothetical protein